MLRDERDERPKKKGTNENRRVDKKGGRVS